MEILDPSVSSKPNKFLKKTSEIFRRLSSLMEGHVFEWKSDESFAPSGSSLLVCRESTTAAADSNSAGPEQAKCQWVIVCAVSALSEGTAIIGRKSYGANAFCHFEGGARNGAKASLPRVYHVGARDSSVCAEQKATNRTSCCQCDCVNKQCKNSRSSSYSVKENVSSGKEKESPDVGLAFRKRNLLWTRTSALYTPKTLRPPMVDRSEEGGRFVLQECCCGKCKCEKPKCRKPKGRRKRPKCRYRESKRRPPPFVAPYELNFKEKKKLLRLKNLRVKPCKRNLDKVKIDDELDLNKRIEKLVGEIAAENKRIANRKLVQAENALEGGDVPCWGDEPPKKVKKPHAFFKCLKNLFRFRKGKCKNKKVNCDYQNSVPVNTVRGASPVAYQAARTNSFDVSKALRRTRFRRNPYRSSYSEYDYPVASHRERLNTHPYSTHFKGKPDFVIPFSRHRLHTRVKRRQHRLLYRSPNGVKRPPFYTFPRRHVKDVRPKRHDQRLCERPYRQRTDFKERRSAEEKAKGKQDASDETDGTEEQGDKEEGTPEERRGGDPTASDFDLDSKDVPDHTLEKPFLERDFRGDALDSYFKTYEARYNLQTDFPVFAPTALHPHRRYKYDLPHNGFLNPYRYLKIRHALRNYLVHNNIFSPTVMDNSAGRKKRCGERCCPIPHKCWRSPPLLCIPYIRKGQDDLLRYLIRTLQKMIGKPLSPRFDIFESTKFKPCSRKDDCPDDEDYECCPSTCRPCPPPPCPPPPCPPPPCPPCPPCPPPPCPPCTPFPRIPPCPPCPPPLCRPPPCPPPPRPCPCGAAPPQICAYAQPVASLTKPSNPPYCPPSQRSCSYDVYNPPGEYSSASEQYSTSSPYSSFSTMEQVVYSTTNCGYDDAVSPNLYPPNFLSSSESPLHSPMLATPSYEEVNFAPTAPSNTLPRAVAPTPVPFGPPSTINACSWYMSKSPVERAEYFSYTALPYKPPAEGPTQPSVPVRPDPNRPDAFQPPCPQSNAQLNPPTPDRLNGEARPANALRSPIPLQPPANPPPPTERFYDTQLKDKPRNTNPRVSNDVYPERANERRNFQADSSPPVKENTPEVVKCDSQQSHISENQIPKSNANFVYSRNGQNKENSANVFKCSDQQVAPSDRQVCKGGDASAEGSKPESKGPDPEVSKSVAPEPAPPAQQPPAPEAHDDYNKNPNREDTYRCGYQSCPQTAPQEVPKTEATVKYPKNPPKEDTLKCDDPPHAPSTQQIPKPDLNNANDDKRFFKTKHHKGILKNFRRPSMEFSHSYDDNYYDRFPHLDPEEEGSLRLNKAPFPRTWRGYTRKVKKSSRPASSVRYKRADDYYLGPETFDNYNDYDSDAALADALNPDEAPPDPNWTAPSFEMFSELAKAVTDPNPTSGNTNSTSSAKAPTTKPSGKHPKPSKKPSLQDFNDKIADNKKANLNDTANSAPSSPSPVLNKGRKTADLNTTEKATADEGASTSAEHTTAASATPTAAAASKATGASIAKPSITPKSSNSTCKTMSSPPKPSANSTSPNLKSSTAATSSKPKESNKTTPPKQKPPTTATPDSTSDSNGSPPDTTPPDATAPAADTTTTTVVPISESNSTACLEYDSDDNSESIDSKKSGKTSFFQTNSKTVGIQSNSKHLTPAKLSDLASGREDLDMADDGQVPTTLKTASIVKGPKKSMTKPSPKVYTRVYPDSMAVDNEVNDTTTTTAGTTAKTVVEKTTQGVGPASSAQLQLLAVCEGYLEVVKLIKAQNQSLGEDLDAELARYCENIISQNFNLQSESSKPKKESSSPAPSTAAANAPAETTEEGTKSNDDPDSEAVEKELQRKVILDMVNGPLSKRPFARRKKGKKRRRKKLKGGGRRVTTAAAGAPEEVTETLSRRKKSSKSKDDCPPSQPHRKKRRKYRREEQTEEEMLKNGIEKQQLELLRLLKERKRALLSYLSNSKVPNKRADVQEAEYFDDDEEIAPGSNMPSYSGTITTKEPEETSKATESDKSFVNETIFPVYAKEYGYDRGGELTEVEVLWRKINEKTHEKKIFKNLSVLALLLTSTSEPQANRVASRFIGSGLEREDLSEIQSKSENKAGYADAVANLNRKTSTASTVTEKKNCSSGNNTYTFVSKPDPKSIVGTAPNSTILHPNITHKVQHKFGVAKDLFQEYTIEFLNYAVYILPIMFTVLFLFCCLCCAVQILKGSKTIKRSKKKKKRQVSSDSETTESERESKKKRRESRRKKHAKASADYDALAKKRSKTFWNVLKLNSGKSNAELNDDNQTEKKKSFLRFLKGRKDDDKGEFSARYHPVDEADENSEAKPGSSGDGKDSRRKKDDRTKTYSQSEAEERRELIALLEELKKIETENTGEKKEVKSVHVQYMTQEDDAPVFQRPEFGFPYQKNVFGMPKGCSPCNKHFPFYQSEGAGVGDYELFEDVNELSELLPCECNYYAKRNDYLRQCDFKVNGEGGCKSFLKIFRDAGVSRSAPFREKNLFKNESEKRSFIFNKYRSISTDASEELMGVTQKNAGTEVRLTDNVFESASPLTLQSKKNGGLVEEMDSLKRQLNNKKHVRLKDNGVLCRL